jgi:predicted nucleic acid-binding protein
MYVLDTDIAIWILRRDTAIIETLKQNVSQNESAISTITIAELYKNIFPSELTSTEEFIAYQRIIPVSAQIAREAGYYWNQFHKRISGLSITDCIIAATAKIHQGVLCTLNTRHFPMSDIIVRNPRRTL